VASADSRGWPPALVAFAATFLLTLLAYGHTVASMVNVWRHSDTFAHGFLILPISLLLAWRSRDSLAPLGPRPYPPALIALVPLGLAWIVGRAASTLVVEHFSFVAMIPVLVVAHFGPRVARRLAFPLAFLFFAVPFGDVFEPRLMKVTADFAETALQWTGIAVTREGLYLTTTNSRWQVIESCSGVRFTIAGVVLATLFAHLSYRSNLKRLLFVAAAVVVSIFANGLRAYVLILVGHLTEMKLGGGFDHYAYGWLVFTIVMTAFFLAGSAFRDRDGDAASAAPQPKSEGSPGAVRTRQWAGAAGLATLLVAVWPSLDALALSRVDDASVAAIHAPPATGAWVLTGDDPSLWSPAFAGATSEVNRLYVSPSGSVQCYIAYYANQTQGREMLHQGNDVLGKADPSWRVLREGIHRTPAGTGALTAREAILNVPDGVMVIWYWYWLPDEYTASPVWSKWLQARSRLLGRGDRAAVVMLSAIAPAPSDAERLLEQFSGDMSASIRRSLRTASTSR
jgi:exosortase A